MLKSLTFSILFVMTLGFGAMPGFSQMGLFLARADADVPDLRLLPVVETDDFLTVEAVINLVNPLGFPYQIDMTGTATVEVFWEGEELGDAHDDDGDGLDEVEVELVALSLTGNDPELGEVILNERLGSLSLGVLHEQLNITSGSLDVAPYFLPGNPTAELRIDIFIELEFNAMPMMNNESNRVVGIVHFSPIGPDNVLAGAWDVNLLQNSQGENTGWTFAFDTLRPGPIDGQVSRVPVPSLADQYLRTTPNPFNPRVQIDFYAAEPGPALLQVFDLQGRLVKVLFQDRLGAGEQTVSWDGRDSFGREASSGVYFLRLETSTGTTGRKISLVQ